MTRKIYPIRLLLRFFSYYTDECDVGVDPSLPALASLPPLLGGTLRHGTRSQQGRNASTLSLLGAHLKGNKLEALSTDLAFENYEKTLKQKNISQFYQLDMQLKVSLKEQFWDMRSYRSIGGKWGELLSLVRRSVGKLLSHPMLIKKTSTKKQNSFGNRKGENLVESRRKGLSTLNQHQTCVWMRQ